MSDTYDLIMAVYPSIDTARGDFDDLVALVEDKSVRSQGLILVEHPEYGWLVTAPSNSPENFPAWPGNGRFFDEVSGLYLKARTMAVGPTMDMQIIREVFAEFSEAAGVLGTDPELAAQARAAAARLAPNSPDVYFALARAYARGGRRDDAKRANARFRELEEARTAAGAP